MKFFSSLMTLALAFSTSTAFATKFDGVKIIDRDYIQLHFRDGDVCFVDNGKGPSANNTTIHDSKNNEVVRYVLPLDTLLAGKISSWLIGSTDDPAYMGEGRPPISCFRKSKLNGMAEMDWMGKDYAYEVTREHFIYLHLPAPLQQGKHYFLLPVAGIQPEMKKAEFLFDIYNSRSEAIHINLVGYPVTSSIKAADLYCWMGDGGERDYTGFVGNKVWIYNPASKVTKEVGIVKFWRKNGKEASGYNLIASDVWTTDFTPFQDTGTFRLVVDGIGCTEDFQIRDDIYHDPFMVSVRGFFYMRIGEDSAGGIRPVPRRPLFIPGKSPENTKVILTSMQPLHPQWRKFTHGDQWDQPKDWAAYALPGNPENPNAFGGHSDALDWDRHLGHVSIIYDMLLPIILSNGSLKDDDLGIAESGNGIPDLMDEARNEVDFWLRLRNGRGYSHGITNPTNDNVLYQAGTTLLAAWANAANCAMLASCFDRTGHEDLARIYADSAINAMEYAQSFPDQELDAAQDIGDGSMRGRDFKMTAAAYLYDVTGNPAWEKMVAEESSVNSDSSMVEGKKINQLWAVAGYLFSRHEIHYKDLYQQMKASIIKEAMEKEAGYSEKRPSRRSSDEDKGYNKTAQNVQRCMIAHAILENGKEKNFFEKALYLEADWGLGRNPLNIIQMTTATTPLSNFRSIENIYTSGRNDGSPGLHPGHTPYLNTDNWGRGMVMHMPGWMLAYCYPSYSGWPKAEGYFNTRYVWSHSEFTPQQTMRGKMALYGYLYAVVKFNK